MKFVYICSPYRAEDAETLQRNIEYAKALTRAALLRGECPVTPHLYMTQCLDENIEGNVESDLKQERKSWGGVTGLLLG